MNPEQFRQENKEVVFDKHWFLKHETKLVKLANSWIGKYIFQFKKMGHHLTNPIVKITPYSVGELISIKGEEVELKEHFFSRNEYARKLYFYLYPLWITMHIWDWFVADHFQLAPQLSFGFSTLTQYPGTIGTHNPDDASVQYSTTNETWATMIAAAGNGIQGSSTSTASAVCIGMDAGNSSGKWNGLYRAIFLFDTSSLTSGATISAAVLSLYGQNKGTYSTTPDIDIYISTPASTSTLAVTDYAQLGSTSQTGSPITYANWSTTGYNDFTFSATGRGNVSKTGISKYGSRNASYDVSGSAPTWTGANCGGFMSCYYAFNGSNKPKLVVTYSVVVGPANLKSLNTNLSANIKSVNTNLIANCKSYNTNV